MHFCPMKRALSNFSQMKVLFLPVAMYNQSVLLCLKNELHV